MQETKTIHGQAVFANSMATRFLSWCFAPYWIPDQIICVTDNSFKVIKPKKRKGTFFIDREIEIEKSDIVWAKRCYWYIGFIFNLFIKRYKICLKNGQKIVLQFNKPLGKPKSFASKSWQKRQPFKTLGFHFDPDVQGRIIEQLNAMKK